MKDTTPSAGLDARLHQSPAQRAPLLSRFGENMELVLVVLGSLLLAFIIITTGGATLPASGFLGLSLLVLTFYRLDWGFFVFFAVVLLSDQFPPPEIKQYLLTSEFQYLDNIKTISYLPRISEAMMTPMELHLLLLFSIWLLIGIVKKTLGWNRLGAWGAVLLFFAALAGWLLYGMTNGGSFMNALWEIRAMFYLVILFFFAPQIIQTKAHVQMLMWILILTLTFKALQAWYFYLTIGHRSFDFTQAFTCHEDPVFMLLVFALLIGLILFRGHRTQQWVIFLFLIPLLMGFYVGQRRAAYAAAGTTMAPFVALLSKKDLWRFMKPFLPLGILTGFYLAVFWNSHSPYASFAQTIKSGFITDKTQQSREDYYSNLWRDIEKYNLAMTVRRVPLFGVGYGNRYDQPIKVMDAIWSLDGIIPHNMVLDLVAKTGAIGFFFFCFFIDAVAFYGAALYPKLRDPYLKAVCLVALAAIINQIVVSYFDLQLTYTRNMVLLGILMGLLTRLKAMDIQVTLSHQARKA